MFSIATLRLISGPDRWRAQPGTIAATGCRTNVTVNYFSVLGDPGSWNHCLSVTLSPEWPLYQAGALINGVQWLAVLALLTGVLV